MSAAATQTKNRDKIHLSAEGVWSQGGEEITHERTKELFFKSILYKNGKYYLTGEKSPVEIDVEDVPYFVRSVSRVNGGYTIKISDGTTEPLILSTLDVRNNNILYCRVKQGRIPAKFERKSYYELAKDITERDGFLGFVADELFYPVRRKEDLKAPTELAAKPVNASVGAVRASPAPSKKVTESKRTSAKPAPAKKSASKNKKPAARKPAKPKVSAKKSVVKKPVKKKNVIKSKKKRK